jgi:hypothetical protein
MKVRTNRRRTLAKISHNKKSRWFLAPILARSAKIKERNDRIKAQVDKMFPELKGVPCPAWIYK